MVHQSKVPMTCCIITITESFSMTKIHKDIAMRLMEVVNDEEYSDQQVVKVCLSDEMIIPN